MQAQTTDCKTSQLNSKLIKQILDCCQMYPAAPALNLVPHTMLLRAARKEGRSSRTLSSITLERQNE